MAVNPSTESRRFSLLADSLLSVTIALLQSPMHRCFVRICCHPWHSNNIASSVIYKPAIYHQQLPEEHNKTKRARWTRVMKRGCSYVNPVGCPCIAPVNAFMILLYTRENLLENMLHCSLYLLVVWFISDNTRFFNDCLHLW